MDGSDRDRFMAYILIGACLLAAALSVLTMRVLVIGATSAVAFASLMTYRIWYIIDAKIFEKSGVVQVLNGFELSGDRSAATCAVNGVYTATAAAVVEALGGVEIDSSRVENLIANLGVPFKIVMSVESLDTKKLMERLQTGKAAKEIRLSRVHNQGSGRGMLTATRLRQEIAFLEGEIRSIGSGGTPLRLVCYIMASAMSESRYKAEETARARLAMVSSEFDAVFNARSRALSNNELVGLLRFDSTLVVA